MTGKNFIWIFLSLFIFAGCESLEDTYKERAGDGQIRYLGKCKDLVVKPGWHSLNVTWTNNPDPMIAKLRLTWTLNEDRNEVILDPGVTSYKIPNLSQDASYEVSICSLGQDEATEFSLPTTTNMRPYTNTHEVVLSFPTLVSKYFFVDDAKQLVLFFSNWSNNVTEARLKYTKADGSAGVLDVTSALISSNKYYLLPDQIKPGESVILERKGYLTTEHDEVVTLEPVTFSTTKTFSTDFKALLLRKYGKDVTQLTDAFLNTIEELEIDYSMNTLEDILYLPNLQKLVLGKNRYLYDSYLTAGSAFLTDSKILGDMARSKFVLNIAHQLNGMTVDRYNLFFFPTDTPTTIPYMTEKGNAAFPEDITFMDKTGWTYDFISEGDRADNNSMTSLGRLFDGDLTTNWQPQNLQYWRSHEIIVEMNGMKTLEGVCVSQMRLAPSSSDLGYFPIMVKIHVSNDGNTWTSATWVDENPLGATGGEHTIIRFKAPTTAALVKLTINDRYTYNYSTRAAEIRFF